MAEKEDIPPQSEDDDNSNGDLSEDQQEALNKIMSELEGNNDDDSENGKETSAEKQNDTTEGLTDEQEAALQKIMAEIGEDSESSSDPDDVSTDTSITAEQEDTLNKIVAELQGNAPETEPISPSDEKDDAKEETESDDSVAEDLSPEQEEALQKIMAEIEGGSDADSSQVETTSDADNSSESESALPASETDNKPEDKSGQDETSGGGGFEALDLSDFESELQKVVQEANSEPPPPRKTKRTPKTDVEKEAVADSKKEKEHTKKKTDQKSPSQTKSPETVEQPSEPLETAKADPQEKSEEKAETTNVNADKQKTDAPTSLSKDSDPLTSGDVDESTSQPASTTASPVKKIEPLKEVEPDTPAPKKKGPAKRKRSFKKIWIYSTTGLVLVLLSFITIKFYPFTINIKNNHETSTDKNEIQDNLSPETQQTDSPSSVPPADKSAQIANQDGPLKEIIVNIKSLRTSLLDKLKEIDDLKKYYLEAIDETEKGLINLIRTQKPNSLKEALSDQRMELALRTIQRRKEYAAKLNLPFDQVLKNSEELLYLERKANIFGDMMENTSGISLDAFEKQVTETIERINQARQELSIDQNSPPPDNLESIWQELNDKIKVTSVRKLSSKEQIKENAIIWKEICSGNFDRKYALTELSQKAAQCLTQWEGKDLYLNRLTTLSPEVAQVLSRWPGEWLGLNGLDSLAPETARYLAQWKGNRLSLNGLTELSPKSTLYLSRWQGRQLELVGLKHIGQWENPKIELFVSDKLRNQIPK